MKSPVSFPRSAGPVARSGKPARRDASVARSSRRDFVRWLTAGLCWPFALEQDALSDTAASFPTLLAQAAPANASSATARSESDVGSLWPFIQSQAVTGGFPLSGLRPEFRSLAGWKRKALGKLLELLHY